MASEHKRASGGGRIVPPAPITRVEPVLPERPQADIRFVVIEALVSKQGDVTQVKIIKGGDNIYTRAVAAALRKWRFRPGTIDGEPADMTYLLTTHIDVH